MKLQNTFTSLATTACLISFVGCKQETATTTTTPPNTQAPAANDEHGHSHAEGEEHAPHGAHGVGPHDGIVADWGGGKYHVEFTVDHDKQQATVYILGSDEKTPMPIDAPSIELSIKDPEMQVILQASPEVGDSAGKASRFIGTHEKLGVVQEYAGTMTGVVDGTPYSGEFTEVAHADHDH